MRSRDSSYLVRAILLLGVSAIVLRGEPAPEPPEWGSLEGQVVWAGVGIPKNSPIAVPPPGLVGNPILQNKLVIDPKSKGVRWVLVWLADPKDATNAKFAPPIHPSLANPPNATMEMSRWEFQPRVLGLWVKKDPIVENNDTVAHTFLMNAIGGGPNANLPLLPGRAAIVRGFVPKLLPTPCSCRVFPWMKGYIGTFVHPYFAVTDADGKFEIENAPVGKFQLVLWHEEVGFLTMTSKKLRGKAIEIEGKGATDVGKIGMKQVED